MEERRTQAVLARRWSDPPESTDDLGALDPEAIAAVGAEAWPEARNSDELHEALTALGCIAEAEAAGQPHWLQWLAELARAGRATRLQVAHDRALWTPLERLAGCVRSIRRRPASRVGHCRPAMTSCSTKRRRWWN